MSNKRLLRPVGNGEQQRRVRQRIDRVEMFHFNMVNPHGQFLRRRTVRNEYGGSSTRFYAENATGRILRQLMVNEIGSAVALPNALVGLCASYGL